MSENETCWYPSKVDWWLALVMLLPPLAAIGLCVAYVVTGQTLLLLVGGLMTLILFGVYIGAVFPMRYGLDAEYLIIRFGLCRLRTPLANVSEVYPTRNPLSAPALSLDRLHVQYGEGFLNSVRISPADRDGFLNDLARRTGLVRTGERLARP